VATEAAWLNGDNLGKKEINEVEREKKRKDETKVLTLTGLLMEAVSPSFTNRRRPRFLARKVLEYNQRLPSTRFVGKKR
jgi:hypothetical protein